MVNKTLELLTRTPVRINCGIYFVPDSILEELGKLIKFTSSIENSEGFKIPVDNRNVVKSELGDCKTNGNLRIGEVKVIIVYANTIILNYKKLQMKGWIIYDEQSFDTRGN